MNARISIVTAVAVLGVALSACSADTPRSAPPPPSASPTTSPPAEVVPTVPVVPVVPTKDPVTQDQSTDDPVTEDQPTRTSSTSADATCPTPPNRGTGASAFEGRWLRHAGVLDLVREHQNSTLVMGAGAANTENWRVTWDQTPCDSGEVIVTLAERTALYGTGVDGMLYAGEELHVRLGEGANYTTVLTMTGFGDNELTWCTSGNYDQACGA